MSYDNIVSIRISNVTILLKNCFDWMFWDEITVLRPNDCINISYYYILSFRISNVTTFVKEVFDGMCSLNCDEMTVL